MICWQSEMVQQNNGHHLTGIIIHNFCPYLKTWGGVFFFFVWRQPKQFFFNSDCLTLYQRAATAMIWATISLNYLDPSVVVQGRINAKNYPTILSNYVHPKEHCSLQCAADSQCYPKLVGRDKKWSRPLGPAPQSDLKYNRTFMVNCEGANVWSHIFASSLLRELKLAVPRANHKATREVTPSRLLKQYRPLPDMSLF